MRRRNVTGVLLRASSLRIYVRARYNNKTAAAQQQHAAAGHAGRALYNECLSYDTNIIVL